MQENEKDKDKEKMKEKEKEKEKEKKTAKEKEKEKESVVGVPGHFLLGRGSVCHDSLLTGKETGTIRKKRQKKRQEKT